MMLICNIFRPRKQINHKLCSLQNMQENKKNLFINFGQVCLHGSGFGSYNINSSHSTSSDINTL